MASPVRNASESAYTTPKTVLPQAADSGIVVNVTTKVFADLQVNTPLQACPCKELFRGGSSESDSSVSANGEAGGIEPCEKSPVRKAIQVIQHLADCSPIGREKEALKRGLQDIEEASPATSKQKFARMQKTLSEHFVQQRDAYVVSKADGTLLVGAHGAKDIVQSTVCQVIKNLKRASKTDSQGLIIVHLDHILQPLEKGFHFCPLNSTFRDRLCSDATVNPMTSVWVAEWRTDSAKQKTSTFFPEKIVSPEHLLWLLAQAQELVQKDQQKLMKIPAVRNLARLEWPALDQDLIIEVYTRNEGTVYWSVFPLFYYASYHEGANFNITANFVLTCEEALSIVKKTKPEPCYQGQNKEGNPYTVIDIAPLIPGCPVRQGVLIYFNLDLSSKKPGASLY